MRGKIGAAVTTEEEIRDDGRLGIARGGRTAGAASVDNYIMRDKSRDVNRRRFRWTPRATTLVPGGVRRRPCVLFGVWSAVMRAGGCDDPVVNGIGSERGRR